MESFTVLPHPLLRPYVEAFVFADMGREEGLYQLDIFPIGYSLLSFDLNERPVYIDPIRNESMSARFNFTGQLSFYRSIQTTSSASVYALLKPTGAFRLLDLPQYIFTNHSYSMTDILHNETRELYARLEDAVANPKGIIQQLEKWLLSRLQNNEKRNIEKIDYACQAIISDSKLSIKHICRKAGMSTSSFQAHFKEKVGLSPKTYSRIIRFNEVLNQLKQSTTIDWQELIYEFNYFDQAHFIHEFKDFFGYTPSQIHRSYKNLAAQIRSGI